MDLFAVKPPAVHPPQGMTTESMEKFLQAAITVSVVLRKFTYPAMFTSFLA